jgi:CRISPR-associated protein Cas2
MRIVVYDISDPSRLRQVAKICEKYLYRVQKSVFEGELTRSQLYALKHDLKKAINTSEDSVIIYFMTRTSTKRKIQLGAMPDDPLTII